MDIERLYRDYNVPFQTEGHKHCRSGWANTACPFCSGNPGLHLGYNEEKDYFFCWRCGWHPTIETIAKLTGFSNREVISFVGNYGGVARRQIRTKEPAIKIRTKGFKFPSGVGALREAHKQYLQRRNFDWSKLEQEWGLLATGPTGSLDGRDYRFRVIAPIEWEGHIVSFQGRDITGRSEMKYKACPKDRELVHHKEILYGKQSEWGRIGICVEGITDVWRLGFAAFATFGISYTPAQMMAMIRSFRRIIILFDDDPQAQEQADKLKAELKMVIDVHKEVIQEDPGSMSQEDADSLVRQLTKGYH